MDFLIRKNQNYWYQFNFYMLGYMVVLFQKYVTNQIHKKMDEFLSIILSDDAKYR
jgi:hypothetical protein